MGRSKSWETEPVCARLWGQRASKQMTQRLSCQKGGHLSGQAGLNGLDRRGTGLEEPNKGPTIEPHETPPGRIWKEDGRLSTWCGLGRRVRELRVKGHWQKAGVDAESNGNGSGKQGLICPPTLRSQLHLRLFLVSEVCVFCLMFLFATFCWAENSL